MKVFSLAVERVWYCTKCTVEGVVVWISDKRQRKERALIVLIGISHSPGDSTNSPSQKITVK
jgi:hypothetical protein